MSAKKYKTTPVYDEASFVKIQSLDDAHEDDAAGLALVRTMTKDDGETLVFARATETIRNKLYKKKYVALKGRSMVPFSPESGMLANDTLVWRVYDGSTMAMLVSDYSTDTVGVKQSAEEFRITFFDFANNYGWSINDIERATKYGLPLQTNEPMLAREGHEAAMDRAVAFGVPQRRTTGLLNNPNASTITLPTGTWSSATGEQMLADLNYFVAQTKELTKEIFPPTRLTMSVAALETIRTKIFNATSGTTVLEMFKKSHPEITVDDWRYCSTSGAGGVPQMVLYNDSEECMEFLVGSEFRVRPARTEGLRVQYDCLSTFAGLMIHHPKGVAYATNHAV